MAYLWHEIKSRSREANCDTFKSSELIMGKKHKGFTRVRPYVLLNITFKIPMENWRKSPSQKAWGITKQAGWQCEAQVKGSFILTTVSPKPCITVNSVDLFFSLVISLKNELAPPNKAFRNRHMTKNTDWN